MSDSPSALADLADRVERSAADGALSSERAVQLRAVEPLLEVLGWDVRGSEVDPEATVAGRDVDYLLAIEDAPTVLVGTAGPGDDLEEAVIDPIDGALADCSADRGIATNGQSIVLLAASDGEVHVRPFSFSELPQHAEALGRYHRSVLAERISALRADRDGAARRLANERDAVVAAVTATIVDVTGEAVEGAVTDEAERAVDSLVASLGDDGDVAGSELTASAGTPEGTSSPAETTSTRDTDDTDEPPVTTAGSSPGERDRTGDSTGGRPDTAPPSSGDETEYVVRFFGGSSSVGAVGTETPGGTTVGTVRYLLENHDLADAIALPWRGAEGTVVLASEPGDDHWSTLSNADGDSIAVRPVDDPARAEATIEDLTEAAGLRAMFQGDW